MGSGVKEKSATDCQKSWSSLLKEDKFLFTVSLHPISNVEMLGYAAQSSAGDIANIWKMQLGQIGRAKVLTDVAKPLK